MTVLGLLKSGKAEAAAHDRSGQLDKTSWRMLQHVRPDHEEVLLDGTAQSVRKNFIMGSDATEFVNRVNDQVRKRQKKCPTLQAKEKNIL